MGEGSHAINKGKDIYSKTCLKVEGYFTCTMEILFSAIKRVVYTNLV